MNTEIRALFADVIYNALINGKDYDDELLNIYDDWFSENEKNSATWDRICKDIEYRINAIILGDIFEED